MANGDPADPDAIWRDLYWRLFVSRFDAAVGEVRALIELAKLGPQDPVIDLGCGPGTHALPFALRGYDVTGVDRSKFLIERARERAAAWKVEVDFQCKDYRDLCSDEPFCFAFSMHHSIAQFDSHQDFIDAMAELRKFLRQSAHIFIDVRSIHGFQKHPIVTSDQPYRVELVQSLSDDGTRVNGKFLAFVPGAPSPKEHFISSLVFSEETMTDSLSAAGFSDIKSYGDLDGSSFCEGRSERLYVLARN